MAYLIGPADCPAVRALVVPGNDPGLSDLELPDYVILMSVYAGAADRAVKAEVPGWATEILNPDREEALKNAVIYRTAALIVRGRYDIVTSVTGDITTRYGVPDRMVRAAELEAQANGEIAGVTGVEGFPDSFIMVGGIRGL